MAFELRCNVCGKPARVVAASAYGATSYAFCDDCLEKGLEPRTAPWSPTSPAPGHFPEDINETYRSDVRRMLPLWGKTEAEFIRDVDAMIQRLEDVE